MLFLTSLISSLNQ